MRSIRPTRNTAVPPFKRRIWACDTPYLSAISESVSPLRILWVTMRRAWVGLAALLRLLLPPLLAPGTLIFVPAMLAGLWLGARLKGASFFAQQGAAT